MGFLKRYDTPAYIIFGLFCAVLLEMLLRFQPMLMLIAAIALVYFGLQRPKHERGRWLLYIGIIMLVLSFLQSIIFQFLLFFGLIYALFLFWHQRKKPKEIHVREGREERRKTELIRPNYFKNILLGDRVREQEVFVSEDINIHCGVGETLIHFGNTVLPSGDTIVIIRGFIGRVKVFVPYDVGISVQHATLFGQTRILDEYEAGMNQNICVRSENYERTSRKLRIYTSLTAGDLEVRYR